MDWEAAPRHPKSPAGVGLLRQVPLSSGTVDAVDESLTRQIAKLARLRLSDEEVTAFTAKLKYVVAYIGSLQEVNVDGVEPMVHAFPEGAALREDVVLPSLRDADGQPKVLGSAPEVLEGGFRVPSILG